MSISRSNPSLITDAESVPTLTPTLSLLSYTTPHERIMTFARRGIHRRAYAMCTLWTRQCHIQCNSHLAKRALCRCRSQKARDTRLLTRSFRGFLSSPLPSSLVRTHREIDRDHQYTIPDQRLGLRLLEVARSNGWWLMNLDESI